MGEEMNRKTANNKKEILIIVGSVIGAILLICGIGLIVLVGGVVSASRNTQRNINTYGEIYLSGQYVQELGCYGWGDDPVEAAMGVRPAMWIELK